MTEVTPSVSRIKRSAACTMVRRVPSVKKSSSSSRWKMATARSEMKHSNQGTQILAGRQSQGFYDIQRGAILVDGVDIREWNVFSSGQRQLLAFARAVQKGRRTGGTGRGGRCGHSELSLAPVGGRMDQGHGLSRRETEAREIFKQRAVDHSQAKKPCRACSKASMCAVVDLTTCDPDAAKLRSRRAPRRLRR
jgi:hypothetical protein